MRAGLTFVCLFTACGGRVQYDSPAPVDSALQPQEDSGAAIDSFESVSEPEPGPEASVVDAASPPVSDSRHEWSRGFGASMISAAVDHTGATLVLGYIFADTDFGGGILRHAGGDDLYFLKLDAAGNHVFSKRFGDNKTQQPGRVAFDAAGNFVVTGNTQGRIDLGGGEFGPSGSTLYERHSFIARYSGDGTHLWGKHLAAVDRARALDVSPKGEILFGGWSTGATAGIPLTGIGGFIARLSPEGAVNFSRTLGEFEVHAVALDGAGNMYVAGDLEGTADFGAGKIARSRDHEGLTVKLDPTGKPLWTYRSTGGGRDVHYALAVSPSGDVLVGGEYGGSLDFGGGVITGELASTPADAFVVALTPAGAHRWSRGFGGPTRIDAVHTLAFDRDGNVYAGGLFSEACDVGGAKLVSRGSTDGFIVAYDRDGAYRWSRTYGGKELDSLNTIAIGGDDRITVAGWNSSPVDLGGGPLSPVGMYVGKLAR